MLTMRVHFSTFTRMMKIVICLCLVLAAIQPSITVQQEISIGSDEKLIGRHWNRTINIRNLQIPENSWWKGSRTRKNDLWFTMWQLFFGIISYVFKPASKIYPSFDTVEYLKDIPADSPIQLDYAVQYLDSSYIFARMSHHSVLLCDTTADVTQDSSILVLVRELLGISEGCPISAGNELKMPQSVQDSNDFQNDVTYLRSSSMNLHDSCP